MQAQADAKAGVIFFALAQKLLRLGERDFVETNDIAGPKLRGDRKVHRDHVRDLWITADGLAITEQQNRLSVGRNLQCSRRDGFGKEALKIGCGGSIGFVGPLAELFGYYSELSNFTSGTASFTMEPSHYAPVREELADLKAAS